MSEISHSSDPATRWFRLAAVGEALSWTGLLVGVYLKRVTEATELGVQVFGPIHGAMFVLYVLATLDAARRRRWGAGTTLVGLVASIPPFTTLAFERWITRRAAAV